MIKCKLEDELSRDDIIIFMNNTNVFSEPEEEKTRNNNAEWAALKETAATSTEHLSMATEYQRNPEEREKYRRRGEWLLKIVNRLPARPDEEEKAEKLTKIHRAAERAGIAEDLTRAIDDKLHPRFVGEIGKLTFENGDEELSIEEEKRVEKLREKVFDLAGSEPGELASQFPSGNFLYHGSSIDKIEKIFQSSGLKNGIALVEDNPETSGFDLNSGYEGISWSMNEIDALPGTRGHIAGFVAAPEDVLADDEQLVVPSRPAPYEVLQMNKKIDAKELYRLKTQYETWGDGGISLGEKNNVHNNLMRMLMYQEGDTFFGSAKAYQYDGDTSAEEMRKHFTLDEDKKVVWDEDMQQKSEVPPALPWFQALIDRGSLQRAGYEDLKDVESVVEQTKHDEDFVKRLIATVKYETKPVEEAYEQGLDAASAVRIRPEEMYFVTSHQDLEPWLKVMARNRVEPKGILLYDDDQVVVENFASDYEGNHKELGAEIGNAVGVNREFWRNEMGFDPEELPRSGHKGQVLLESTVKRDKSIQMQDGELIVV